MDRPRAWLNMLCETTGAVPHILAQEQIVDAWQSEGQVSNWAYANSIDGGPPPMSAQDSANLYDNIRRSSGFVMTGEFPFIATYRLLKSKGVHVGKWPENLEKPPLYGEVIIEGRRIPWAYTWHWGRTTSYGTREHANQYVSSVAFAWVYAMSFKNQSAAV